MAWFTAKEWKNRLVEFAGRRSLKNVSTNETTVYDVTRNEGQVSQEGDSFSATTMNDLEQRISEGFSAAEEANSQLSSELAAAKQSFQAGVDTLYSKCSSRGATPSAKTPMAIAGAIDKIYTDRYNAGKKAAEIKTVSKSAEYPMAGANGEQTVDFSVDFGAVSGYKLAYAGITALDTYISNGTIKYVQFSNLRISGTKATWSVHTARGTGGGNNTCTVQGIFIPA